MLGLPKMKHSCCHFLHPLPQHPPQLEPLWSAVVDSFDVYYDITFLILPGYCHFMVIKQALIFEDFDL